MTPRGRASSVFSFFGFEKNKTKFEAKKKKVWLPVKVPFTFFFFLTKSEMVCRGGAKRSAPPAHHPRHLDRISEPRTPLIRCASRRRTTSTARKQRLRCIISDFQTESSPSHQKVPQEWREHFLHSLNFRTGPFSPHGRSLTGCFKTDILASFF